MKASFMPLRDGADEIRRTLLKAGLAGSLFLLIGRAYAPLCAGCPAGSTLEFLRADDVVVLQRVIAVMLRGSLPLDEGQQKAVVGKVIDGIDTTVSFMAPATRKEVRNLLNLLQLRVARLMAGGFWRSWDRASEGEVEEVLANWRRSHFVMLRSVYVALHTLCMGHWYANRESWARIGYAGPPKLA
jgi:hypothetical protein